VATGRWILLAYKLPREPSTPRLSVWRKLKRLGAAQLLDGLVALPLDGRNREQLEWLADEALDAGGEATIWVAEPASAAQERALARSLQEAIAAQYRQVMLEALGATSHRGGTNRRTLGRLRRQLGRIRRRDYFPPPEREEAERAVEALAKSVEDAAA
jgi:hypothetical protein